MNNPTIQLLVARWYPGSGIAPSDARAELRRRGWSRVRQTAALAVLLPVIALDRLVQRADPARDETEETGIPREVAFSAMFSVFVVSVVAALVSGGLVVSRHDSGQPYQWHWLVGWVTIAAISGWAARAVGRVRA